MKPPIRIRSHGLSPTQWRRLQGLATRVLEGLLALLLAAMVVLVFGNVVLRYAFNSGLAYAEELSRFCFVWLVFLGAVLALRERAHLGMDGLLRRLPHAARRACVVISHGLMLLACSVLVRGSWSHMVLGQSNLAPVTGLPLSWLNAAGVACGAAMAVLLFVDLARQLRAPLREGKEAQ